MGIAIHQFLVGAGQGDAVTNHALFIQKLLQQKGYESVIYGSYINPNIKNKIKHYSKYNVQKNDMIIYHFSIGDPLNDWIKNLAVENKVMIYHNITPAKSFIQYQPKLAKLCHIGRKNLCEHKDTYRTVICDSHYNANELRELGYQNIFVVPIPIDTKIYDLAPNQKLLKKMKTDGNAHIIFVGRIAPNKNYEDIIKIFYHYQKYINPNSQLHLVGNYDPQDPYYYKLKQYIEILEMKDKIDLTGFVDVKDISSYYQGANLFLSASKHEGFCVPIVEAMYFKLPILAFARSAVPETLGSGGILFRTMDYSQIALMSDEIIKNQQLRNIITKNQTCELQRFHILEISEKLTEILHL